MCFYICVFLYLSIYGQGNTCTSFLFFHCWFCICVFVERLLRASLAQMRLPLSLLLSQGWPLRLPCRPPCCPPCPPYHPPRPPGEVFACISCPDAPPLLPPSLPGLASASAGFCLTERSSRPRDPPLVEDGIAPPVTEDLSKEEDCGSDDTGVGNDAGWY